MRVARALVTLAVLSAPADTSTVRAGSDVEELTLDVHVFRQDDGGGNPHMAEGMEFAGLQATVRARVDHDKSVFVNVSAGHISNDPSKPLPATIRRSDITSASTKILAIDGQLRLDYYPRDSPWRVSGGLYYHHQHYDIRFGLDFAAVGELAGGDSVLTLSYGLRWGIPQPIGWDQDRPSRDNVLSHTLLVGLTQILGPSWLLHASLQYTRQDGLLTNHYNFITLHDTAGTPVDLSTESLPRQRNRVQLNLRGRWSPRVGLSIGLDTSGYLDDWGIRHAAVEPNIEVPIDGRALRLRLWYRLALQSRVDYFVDRPTAPRQYQTQDSDLDAWTMHGPGLVVMIPLAQPAGPDEPTWIARVMAFGFIRSDAIYAAGAQLGMTATW